MVINVLETEELLKLSLLKCKVCHGRLRSPVLQVDRFSNVCGSCHDREVHTDAVRNVDLEALLQKLYLPCNYAERGCEFEGSFDDVCVHEKVCALRQIKCPLSLYELCDGRIGDTIEHMKSKHPDNVLTVVENHVSIKNPNENRLSAFYLLVADNLNFILRAQFDDKKGDIVYWFYCLNYNIDIRHVKISIVLKYENTICNVENVHINILRKGEIPSLLNVKDATKLKLGALENFGCSDSVTVKIVSARGIEAGKIETKLCKSAWYKCTHCSAMSKDIHYCNARNRIICCENCFKGSYSSHCGCSATQQHNHYGVNYGVTQTVKHIIIKLDQINSNTTFLCTNPGCNEGISGDNYAIHTKSQCRFRQLNCPFSTSTSCKWTGASIALTAHIKDEHTDRVNENSCAIPNAPSVRVSQIYFIKENNAFIQTYQILNNQLIVTTKKLDDNEYGNNYKWLIYFKHPVNSCEVLLSDMCTSGESKTTIDVTSFLADGPFTLKVLFKLTNTVSS